MEKRSHAEPQRIFGIFIIIADAHEWENPKNLGHRENDYLRKFNAKNAKNAKVFEVV